MQTVQPLEIIVVDDGSTDDLDTALAHFSGRTRVWRVEHAGPAAARNAGIAAACGEFVAFLDADDAYEPQFLEALGALARERPDLDILATDCTFEVDGQPAGCFYDANVFPTADQRTAILRSCFLTTKIAVRRVTLLNAGGFDATMVPAEDWDMWLQLIIGGAAAGLIDAPLARYRLGRSGQLTERRVASLEARVRVLEKACSLPELSEDERRLVALLVPRMKRRAALAGVAEAGTSGGARRAWFAVSRRGDLPVRTRLLGAVGSVAPRAMLAAFGESKAIP